MRKFFLTHFKALSIFEVEHQNTFQYHALPFPTCIIQIYTKFANFTGYIFRYLKYFAAKHWDFTNF